MTAAGQQRFAALVRLYAYVGSATFATAALLEHSTAFVATAISACAVVPPASSLAARHHAGNGNELDFEAVVMMTAWMMTVAWVPGNETVVWWYRMTGNPLVYPSHLEEHAPLGLGLTVGTLQSHLLCEEVFGCNSFPGYCTY